MAPIEQLWRQVQVVGTYLRNKHASCHSPGQKVGDGLHTLTIQPIFKGKRSYSVHKSCKEMRTCEVRELLPTIAAWQRYRNIKSRCGRATKSHGSCFLKKNSTNLRHS
eukprot:5898866-Amphidinium_carterae.1